MCTNSDQHDYGYGFVNLIESWRKAVKLSEERKNNNYNNAYQTKLSNDFNQVMEKIQQKYSLIILDGIGKRACVCVFFIKNA